MLDAWAAVGAVGAAAAWQAWCVGANLRWYAGLTKPAFSPGSWTAACLSAALAATMAAAFLRVLRSPDYLPDRPAAIRLFLAGLVLDAAWSWLLFAGRHPSAALAAAAALAAVVPLAVWRFATVDRRAGLLLTPWIPAALFVFLLDLSITLRNG